MYTHPDTAATLDHDRHRDMRADISQHRQVRQLRDLATAAQAARQPVRERPEQPARAASDQETAMFTHPYISSKLHHDRHRDMRADVGQHRLARQVRILTRASQRAGETPRRQRRPWRPALRQRPAPGQARAS